MPRSTNVQNLLSCRAIVPPLTTRSMTTDQVAPHLPITHPFEPAQQPHTVVVHQAHPPSQHTEMTYPSGAEPPYQGHQLGHVNVTNSVSRVPGLSPPRNPIITNIAMSSVLPTSTKQFHRILKRRVARQCWRKHFVSRTSNESHTCTSLATNMLCAVLVVPVVDSSQL
jgi:hypothetical protein